MFRIRSMPFAFGPLLGAAGGAVALVFGLSCVSCAAAADSTAAPTVQLMLKTTAPSPGDVADSLARQVATSARVPLESVRYVAASGGDWHAVSVRCDTSARCDDVVARLSEDKTHFSAVTRDERRKALTGSSR